MNLFDLFSFRARFLRGWFQLASCVWGLLFLCLSTSFAGTRLQQDFLPPEQAFVFSATWAQADQIEVSYRIAPGYYLYRERFQFDVKPATIGLGKIDLPAGVLKYDETFQKNMELYRDVLRFKIPVQTNGQSFTLTVISQGCADEGICYPPMESVFSGGASETTSEVMASSQVTGVASLPSLTGLLRARDDFGALSEQLRALPWWVLLPGFVLLGLSLSLTPCVLPMLPILSSIIVGNGVTASRSRSFALSVAYVLGMAVVYAVAGVASALLGAGLSAALQTPLILGLFAALLVVLSLSMFGVYELQLPAALRDRLSSAGRAGNMVGVFVMGALSAVIVGPCVTAPLAGVLALIAQSGVPLQGGVLLFALAFGMGIPLLLIGAGAGRWLPKAGPWMEGVKRVFGMLLLAVALWMLQPILSAWLSMLGWALWLLAASAALLGTWVRLGEQHGSSARLRQMGGLLLALLGILEIVGLLAGGRNPLQPLDFLRAQMVASDGQATPTNMAMGADRVVVAGLEFRRVRSGAELDSILAAATRPVILDFYADWCVSCKEMEALTFTDARAHAALQSFLLLRADVTANNAQDQALLKRFGLYGPPGILFFDRAGREIPDRRVVGFLPAGRFTQTLSQVLKGRASY